MTLAPVLALSATAVGVAIGAALSSCGPPNEDDALGVTFPERIGALDLQYRQAYEQPGLGYALRYEDAHLFKVDVYVYDLDLPDIGDGPDSERVEQEFESLLGNMAEMERLGKYEGVELVAQGRTSFPSGDLEFLWSRHRYRQLPGEDVAYLGPRISETYLSAKSGKFIKVRLTMKEEEYQDRLGEIDSFMRHVGGLLGARLPDGDHADGRTARQPHVSTSRTQPRGILRPPGTRRAYTGAGGPVVA